MDIQILFMELKKKLFFIDKRPTEVEFQKNLESLREKLNDDNIKKINGKNQVTVVNKSYISDMRNPYETFFNKSDSVRIAYSLQVKKNKNDLQKMIAVKRNYSNINELFKKGRNYEAKPLTKKEIKALKEEALEIEELNKKTVDLMRNLNEKDFAMFKFDKMERIVYGKNGKVIQENKQPFKTNRAVFSIGNEDFIVDGKKVTKEEFLKYQENPENFKNFKKDDANEIKLLKEQRVGDGKYSYAMKYEIVTKKEDGKIKYYVNGVEIEKPALDAELKVSDIKYVNVEKGENGNRIYIVTKK